MMKKIILIISIALLATPSFSQYNEWYISLAMGGAWPMGDYSLDNPDQSGIGYAEKGFMLTVDGTYAITPAFGVKGMFLFGTNLVNEGAVKSTLEQRIYEFYSPGEINTNYFIFNVDYWLWGSILFGPQYSLRLGKIFWDFYITGGPNGIDLPRQTLIYDNPDNKWFYQDREVNKTDFSMAWLAGTDIRLALGERTNLKFGISYFNTKAEMSTEQIEVNKDTGEIQKQHGSSSTKIPISTFNTTIGFVYLLE